MGAGKVECVLTVEDGDGFIVDGTAGTEDARVEVWDRVVIAGQDSYLGRKQSARRCNILGGYEKMRPDHTPDFGRKDFEEDALILRLAYQHRFHLYIVSIPRKSLWPSMRVDWMELLSIRSLS